MTAVLQPAAVHTSAPEADLFGETPAADDKPAGATVIITFTGVLAHDAELRMVPLGDGHFVPAVCLDIDDVGAGHHRVHAEHPFTDATRHDAEQLAKRLRRGMPVTVATGLTDIRVALPAARIFPPT
jgi:hypothetical protein